MTQLQYVVWTYLAPISWKLPPGRSSSGDGVISGLPALAVDIDVGVSDGRAEHRVSAAVELCACGAHGLDSLAWDRGVLLDIVAMEGSTTDVAVAEDRLGFGESAVLGVLKLASTRLSRVVRMMIASIVADCSVS